MNVIHFVFGRIVLIYFSTGMPNNFFYYIYLHIFRRMHAYRQFKHGGLKFYIQIGYQIMQWYVTGIWCDVIEIWKRVICDEILRGGSLANHTFYSKCKFCYFVILYVCSLFRLKSYTLHVIQWQFCYSIDIVFDIVYSGVDYLTSLSTIGLAKYQLSTPLVVQYQTRYRYCNIIFPIYSILPNLTNRMTWMIRCKFRKDYVIYYSRLESNSWNNDYKWRSFLNRTKWLNINK